MSSEMINGIIRRLLKINNQENIIYDLCNLTVNNSVDETHLNYNEIAKYRNT